MRLTVYKEFRDDGDSHIFSIGKCLNGPSLFCRLVFFLFLLLSTLYCSAALEKTVKVTVGSSFSISPWLDAKSSFSGYSCYQTSYGYQDATAFSVTESSRTKTRYPTLYSSSGYSDGYYCSYRVKALKIGSYILYGYAGVAKRAGTSNYSGVAEVIYHVVVEARKVVTSITIPSDLTLTIGESYTFSPIIYETGANTALTWTSSNSSVVSVNNGTINALATGTSTITCTASNGVNAKCIVTVNPIRVNEITLSSTKHQMEKLGKLQLSAIILPENATNKTLTWSSTDESVAIVDNSGLVTALSTGTCFIKATANDDSGKSDMCEIEVLKDNKLEIKDVSICKGGYEALHVYINNEDVIAGFQFDLELPTGITIQKNESGMLSTNLVDFASGHTVSVNMVEDGLYRFVVVSLTGKSIAPHNDEILTIDVNASDDVTDGTYEIKIKNIGLTVKNGNDYEELHPFDRKATLTIVPAIPGDVNGDSDISVTDVISIISYVLEEMPNKFLIPAADMNGDGNITVTDAVLVINNILGK